MGVAVAVVLGSACAGPGIEETRPEKAAVDATINQVIVPGVEGVAESAWRLTDELEAWCGDPRPAAARNVRARWVDVVGQWSASTTFGIGPAIERDSDTRVQRGFSVLADLTAADADRRRCPEFLAAAREVEKETAALERAWNAGPEDGLPFRSTAAGIGEGSLDHETAVAAIRGAQMDAVRTELAHAPAGAEMSVDELERWSVESRGRLDGIRAGLAHLGGLAGPAEARRQDAAVRAAIRALPDVATASGSDWGRYEAALDELMDALRAGSPSPDR